jgi:hypothetical protein
MSAMVPPAEVDEPRLTANASPLGHPARETRADVRSAYTSKIIKAGALLGDTRTLFALWDLDQPVGANLERFRRQNLLGKTSRKRADDVLAIFRQRYLEDERTARALAILTQADRLLHDVVTDLLAVPGRDAEVSAVEVQRFIQELTRDAAGRQLWSSETALRIAQGLLSSLRDFGILKGMAAQEPVTTYLSDPGFRPLPAVVADWINGLPAVDAKRDNVFLTRATAMAPAIYHMSKLLDELQDPTAITTVLCSPGGLEGTTGLRFMNLQHREAMGNYRVKIYG